MIFFENKIGTITSEEIEIQENSWKLNDVIEIDFKKINNNKFSNIIILVLVVCIHTYLFSSLTILLFSIIYFVYLFCYKRDYLILVTSKSHQSKSFKIENVKKKDIELFIVQFNTAIK